MAQCPVSALTGHWAVSNAHARSSDSGGGAGLPGPGTGLSVSGQRSWATDTAVSEDTAVLQWHDTWPDNAARQLTSKSEQCISSDICCITGSHVWHGGGRGEASQAQVTFVYTVQLTCNAVCICHGDLLLLSDPRDRVLVSRAPTHGVSHWVILRHVTCAPAMVMHHISPGPHTSSQMYHPGSDMRCAANMKTFPVNMFQAVNVLRITKAYNSSGILFLMIKSLILWD